MGLFDKPKAIGVAGDHRISQLEDRVRRLEATVAALSRQAAAPGAAHGSTAAITPSGEPAYVAEARELLRDGKTIHAIKLVREHTGWGLREAKEFVERL